MNIRGVPFAAVTLLLVALVRFITKMYYGLTQYTYICFVLDGVLVGVMLCYLLYYANIYVSAWVKNRRESRAA